MKTSRIEKDIKLSVVDLYGRGDKQNWSQAKGGIYLTYRKTMIILMINIVS